MSHGTISEYTCKSRTRRAMSCPYCAPKSTTMTNWLDGVAGMGLSFARAAAKRRRPQYASLF